MRTAFADKYAKALIGVAASRGRAEESAKQLSAAAEFFGTADGKAAIEILHSSKIARAERDGLCADISKSLALNGEVEAIIRDFAKGRVLPKLATVAARARAAAARLSDHAEAELRTARELSPQSTEAIRAAAERVAGRPVKMSVVEDASLIGGVVLRIGNSIWDGSLAGRLGRAAEALAQQ